jgi:cell division septum initiation protein DivIVA
MLMYIKHSCRVGELMEIQEQLSTGTSAIEQLRLGSSHLAASMRRTDKKALLREAGEHAARLLQLAERARAEADERLTQEAIAECRRYIASLEEAKAFWLKVLQDSLEATSGGGEA